MDNAEIEKIYKQNTQHFSSWISTAKYLLRAGSGEEKHALLMKNEQGDFSMWRAVSWIIFRRIIISHELIKTRKKIIKMAFGKYSLPLNEKELENLFQDPSNWWLDLTPEKIKLVRWFCDALLGDDDFCKQICCESACSSDDYFQIVEKCRNAFNKIYRWSFRIFKS